MSTIGIGFDEIEEFLIMDVDIEAQGTPTDDGGGGSKTNWVFASDTKGLIVPIKGEEVEKYGKQNIEVNRKVYLKKDAVVSTDNRLLIESNYLDVEYVKDPMSSGSFLICFCMSS